MHQELASNIERLLFVYIEIASQKNVMLTKVTLSIAPLALIFFIRFANVCFYMENIVCNNCLLHTIFARHY